SGEGDPGDVAGGRLLSHEVPDGLVGVREVVGEERAAVVLGEDPGVAPALTGQRAGVFLREWADVEDVDDEEVAGLGTLYRERPAEGVHDRERRVPDVVRGVVVLDLS